ncbi:aminotransferase class I/II-fold pyridoxal phosphate-dependent enzyme [Pseudoruegeria sp. M32A2M]|nr:aminotransferase class I/II-fold pyridoxal phosphate-dependent enzyme [Pseudoruegeria sp. M32A2M]
MGIGRHIPRRPDRTTDKAILLVNPSNATGRVLSEQTLRRVVAIARERAVLIILDDPYSALVHDDRESFFNLASAGEV